MASPQVRTIEYILSKRVSDFEGLTGLIIGNFDKGPADRTFITDSKQADIVVGKPKPGSHISYYIMHSFLQKSKRLWVRRVTKDALYGGVKIGSSWNVALGTGNGVLTQFTGVLPFSRCIPGTVTIWADNVKVAYDIANSDDQAGDLHGTALLSGGINTVNYTTGEVTVTFQTAIISGAVVYARWGFENEGFITGMTDPSIYGFDDKEIQLTLKTPVSGSGTLTYGDMIVPSDLVFPLTEPIAYTEATFVIYNRVGTSLVPLAYAKMDGEIVGVTANWIVAGGELDYTTGEINFVVDTTNYTDPCDLVCSYKSFLSCYCLVYSDNPGSWSSDYSVSIHGLNIPNNIFNLDIFENRSGVAPLLVDKFQVSNEYKMDGYNRQLFMEERVNGNSYFIRTKANPNYSTLSFTTSPNEDYEHMSISVVYGRVTMSGGDTGTTPSVADYINALNEFNNKEDVKVDIIMDSVGHPTYQNAIIDFCDRDYGGRGDCYGVLYVPFEYEMSNNYVNDTVNYRKYILARSSSFAGLYFGHVEVYDSYNGRSIYIPPTGFVGAVFSYTADQYQPWFAAAGWDRGSLAVSNIYRKLKLGERDILYDNGINAMKFKPGRGVAIWGQKTLYDQEAPINRANVRWLLIVAENAIEEYLENKMFEINDNFTRNELRITVAQYLSTVKNRRGLYDFQVVCDDTNNPADVIDRNELYLDYYLKPTITGEYYYARAVVTSTGARFEDFRIA